MHRVQRGGGGGGKMKMKIQKQTEDRAFLQVTTGNWF